MLELSVADDDYGNVIGRGGRTAAALRTVDQERGGTSRTAPRLRRHRRRIIASDRRLAARRPGRQPARARRQLPRRRPAAPAAEPRRDRRGRRHAARDRAPRRVPISALILRLEGHDDRRQRRRCAARSCSRRAPTRRSSRRTSGGPRISRAAPSTTAGARSAPCAGCSRCPRARCSRWTARASEADLLVPLVADAVRTVDVERRDDRHRPRVPGRSGDGDRRLHAVPGGVRVVRVPAPRRNALGRRAPARRTSTTATTRRSAPGRSTTRRSAAAPAWCCGSTWSRRRCGRATAAIPSSCRAERRVIALTPGGRVLDDALVEELRASRR